MVDLAAEFELPLEEVGAMYDEQRMGLMPGAKVGKYLSIFAVRNIRLQLSQRRGNSGNHEWAKMHFMRRWGM
jgi:hypothetical protein